MAKRRLAPRVGAKRPSRHRRRRGRGRHAGSGWLTTMKVVLLLHRPRSRRSSPSVRQIALVVVSAGLAILVIRVATRRARSQTPATQPEPQDAAREAPATGETPGSDTVTASESPLTDRVQSEMSRQANAVRPDP